jgi:hypothetical protein
MGHVTFLLLFLPVCNYHNRKGMAPSSQGKKQIEASLSGSNLRNLYVKKLFLTKKKSCTVMRTVKKIENVFACYSKTGRDTSQKFQQIWIHHVKTNFPE